MLIGVSLLEESLAISINNAERQLKEKYGADGVFENFDTLFKSWLLSFWGITVGEARLMATYSPTSDWFQIRYWSIKEYKSDEKLVMFKLTYG